MITKSSTTSFENMRRTGVSVQMLSSDSASRWKPRTSLTQWNACSSSHATFRNSSDQRELLHVRPWKRQVLDKTIADACFSAWTNLALFLVLVSGMLAPTASQEIPPLEETKVLSVDGVSGSRAELPCPLNPHTPGDRPKLVLWYRRGDSKPISSYDGRAPRLAHPAADSSQGPHLMVSRIAASLVQPVLSPALTGLYECRVDFFRSPTHVNLVNLTVIEPPSSVGIVDNLAGSSRVRLLGPYPQGSQLTLSCLVTGGIPTPTISWTRNGKDIKIEAVESKENQVTRSDLTIPALPRSWNNANVTCTAWNSDLTPPISASVTIHMYLSASSVVVQGPAATVSGQLASLQCWARGSTPPASLSWAINGQPLHPHREESSITEGVSTSEVEVKVTPADNGAVVSCSALNPAVDAISPPTNTTKLVVYYPPTVSVEFGLNIEVKRLKEGDDVYLRCRVSANPPPDKISWFHENRPVLPNRTRGIIMSGDSLALQKVDRHMAGQYRCAAANHLANATSRPLPLKLAYKPVCMMPSTTTYFIYDQPINVTCHVASHPPATRIDWYWNSGNDIISLQPTSSIPETMTRRPPPLASDWDRSWARLSVRPSKHQEDRQLSCWANNIMGRQEMPCRFFIRVAQTPAPVSSCRLANITASSVSLTCARPPHPQPGTTQYFAEVYEEDGQFMANLSSDRPWFNISQLDPGTAYKLKVYVAHGPIASVPVEVSAYTSNTPVQQPSRPTTSSNYGYESGLVATGIGITLCFIIVIAVIIRKASLESTRNSMNQTLSGSPKSHLTKSTATLTGVAGDEDASEVRETDLADLEDMAGFEKKATCVSTSKTSSSDDDSVRFSKIDVNSRFDKMHLSSSTRFDSETNLSEHQLMLPKGEKFFSERLSPEGRKEENFEDVGGSVEVAPFARTPEAWMDLINDELANTSPREVLLAEMSTR